jgi:hypothetical protein
MDKWPPDSIDPYDPDWTNVGRAAGLANVTEKAIRENIHHFGVYWFGTWRVSQKRLLSTAWSKPAKKRKCSPDQGSLDI